MDIAQLQQGREVGAGGSNPEDDCSATLGQPCWAEREQVRGKRNISTPCDGCLLREVFCVDGSGLCVTLKLKCASA